MRKHTINATSELLAMLAGVEEYKVLFMSKDQLITRMKAVMPDIIRSWKTQQLFIQAQILERLLPILRSFEDTVNQELEARQRKKYLESE